MTIHDPTAMQEAANARRAPPPGPRARPARPSGSSHAERSRGPILVVDDDECIATLLADFLESAGYAVYTASNGYNGLIIARAIHPELVLTDYQMPELDGQQVIHALRAHPSTRDIPTVLMSSTHPHAGTPRGVPFLSKPFDLDEVLGLVEHHLGGPRAPTRGPRRRDARSDA